MRYLLITAIIALCGCSNYQYGIEKKPEVIYSSNETNPTKIIRLTSSNIATVWFTPEGSRTVTNSYNQNHYIINPDQSKIDLPFLEYKRVESRKGEGVFAKVFAVNNGTAWVAIGDRFNGPNYLFYNGHTWAGTYYGTKNVKTSIFIKVFTKDSLIRDADYDVCDPSNVENPAIQIDNSTPAIRFRSKMGTKVYLPLTGEVIVEGPLDRCTELKHKTRDREKYYEYTSIEVKRNQ